MTTDFAVLAEDPTQYDYAATGPRSNGDWAKRYLLFLEDVTAVFDGFKALDIHDLGIGHNELRVVVGPNGAGKSTMCDVISGMTRPATGNVYFAGTKITHRSEPEIAKMGVGRKFQIPNVFDSLTVWENMLLALPFPALRINGAAFAKGWHAGSAGLIGVAALKLGLVVKNMGGRPTRDNCDRICSILERVRLVDLLHVPARNLSHGQRQWLAISSLIVRSPKLLLVDEPAAGLTDKETELTAELLLELKGNHTIIVIEHDMEFVRRLNSRVTVLDNGKVLADGTLQQVQEDPAVIEAYLGR
jgi:urea transport system ATP-binding protein